MSIRKKLRYELQTRSGWSHPFFEEKLEKSLRILCPPLGERGEACPGASNIRSKNKRFASKVFS
jgi:hypothetical protein